MISDTKMLTWAVLLALVFTAQGFAGPAADVLQAVTAAPAHVVAKFDEDAAFAVTREGEYVVLDRRGHGLYVLDAAGARVRRIVSPGIGPGELFNPLALALNGTISSRSQIRRTAWIVCSTSRQTDCAWAASTCP